MAPTPEHQLLPRGYMAGLVGGGVEVTLCIILLAIALSAYLCLIGVSTLFIGHTALKRWPHTGQNENGLLTMLVLVSSLLLACVWPVSVPAVWIARGLHNSDWSICSWSYTAWRRQRRQKKERIARDIELGAMNRARRMQEAEQERQDEEHQRFKNFQEIRARMQQRMNAELGRTAPVAAAGSSSPSSSSSRSAPAPWASDAGSDAVVASKAPEETLDATAPRSSEGDSIKSESEDGFVIIPTPAAMPNPNQTRVLAPPSPPAASFHRQTSAETTNETWPTRS